MAVKIITVVNEVAPSCEVHLAKVELAWVPARKRTFAFQQELPLQGPFEGPSHGWQFAYGPPYYRYIDVPNSLFISFNYDLSSKRSAENMQKVFWYLEGVYDQQRVFYHPSQSNGRKSCFPNCFLDGVCLGRGQDFRSLKEWLDRFWLTSFTSRELIPETFQFSPDYLYYELDLFLQRTVFERLPISDLSIADRILEQIPTDWNLR